MASATKSSARRSPDRSAKLPSERNFFENLGPGLITGAADDDPSGISTYSVAGASFGYSPLWTALLSLPMMVSVQLMCARLGAVTHHGLAHEVRLRYPCWVLWGTCALLAIANIVNLGADLGGMGDVTATITGLNPLVLTVGYAILIVALVFWSSYKSIARIFKWLTLVLFAYIFAAFLAHPDWKAVLAATLVPHFTFSRDFLSVLVAILGTTISPYLFFWQAAQECEERHANGVAKGNKGAYLRGVHIDVVTGMVYSNLIMYFIILTTGATLHAHGQTDITTAKQAAEALLPLAGRGAYLLFALGIVGTGMLGVPVLAGSCGYAFAEAAAWRGTLDVPPRRAPQFYAVIGAAIGAGLILNFARVNAVKMLFWSAIVNGVLAPPLILLVILLTSSRTVMGSEVSPLPIRFLGWATFVFMSAAAIAMFLV
jgi:NRAMP (natural resistance-associated macrophage protein)-like metal ion transporter